MVLEVAMLTAIDPNNQQPKSIPPPVTVQFNPEKLTVNHTTSGTPGKGSTSNSRNNEGNPAQVTGFNTGLSMDLLFDTSQSGEDVRNKTLAISKMMQVPNKNASPNVQFSWGTFVFRGIIQSMDETIDLFSERGVPLRATVALRMSGVDLEPQKPGASGGFGIGVSVGTTPLTLTQAGDTLQSLTGRAGISGSWKGVASANNIDNPRQMDPGTVLNLNAGARANVS